MSAQPAEDARVVERGVPYRWVYLWHWPIRAMHWTAAAAIVVLIVTGFYIGRPYFMPPVGTADPFLMGWMRLAHFLAAGVLVATAVVRIYWLFAGNRYERWSALLPVTRRSLRGMVEMARYYLLLPGARHPRYLGHNPLQQVAYTGVYALAAIQVVTGFALYGLANPGGPFHQASFWVAWFPNGIRGVRFLHHVLTWAFLVFIPLHVYLSLRADVVDREGTASSIVSGGRWVRADRSYEDA